MALITVTAGISCSLIQCKVSSIMEPLSAQFGMDLLTGSWMMTIFTAMAVVFSIPAGKVIERLGAKRVLTGSIVLMLAGSLLGTFAPNAAVLLLSRAIEGIALVSTTIAGATFIRESAPPQRMATAVGIWSVWFASGSFIAGVLSPAIYNSLGFEALWLIYAAVALAASLAIRFFVAAPNLVTVPGAGSEAMSSRADSKATTRPSYRELATRDVVLCMLVFLIYNLLNLAMVTYVPTVLQNQGYEASLSGLISTLPLFISIASAPLLGIVSDRLGVVKPLMSAALAVLAACTPLMFLLTGWPLWAVAVVSGIFGCSGATLTMVALLKVLPRVQLVPLALGLFSMSLGIGQFLGSFLIPIFLGPQMNNYAFTAIALAGIGALGLLCNLLCRYK
jgi:MFS family permease